MKCDKKDLLPIEPELEKAQKTLGITLSETQKQAVRMVFATGRGGTVSQTIPGVTGAFTAAQFVYDPAGDRQ